MRRLAATELVRLNWCVGADLTHPTAPTSGQTGFTELVRRRGLDAPYGSGFWPDWVDSHGQDWVDGDALGGKPVLEVRRCVGSEPDAKAHGLAEGLNFCRIRSTNSKASTVRLAYISSSPS